MRRLRLVANVLSLDSLLTLLGKVSLRLLQSGLLGSHVLVHWSLVTVQVLPILIILLLIDEFLKAMKKISKTVVGQ